MLARKGQSPMGRTTTTSRSSRRRRSTRRSRAASQKYITGTIFVAADLGDATARAQTEITRLLRDRHHIAPGADDDFSIRNLAEIASAQQEGTETLTTLLASIAAVSLLVGGIGIMNIMLVSVTERTREIGMRMAVGAKPRDILAQFLVEALTLSLAGGVIGVALGVWSRAAARGKFDWPLLHAPGHRAHRGRLQRARRRRLRPLSRRARRRTSIRSTRSGTNDSRLYTR